MTYSYVTTDSFTLTNAKKLAAKVTADLYQCRRLYGDPSESSVVKYNDELVVMLLGDYVASYEFGYEKGDRRVVSWYYTITPAGDLEGGRSGGLYAQAEISGARWFNVMTTSSTWSKLTEAQREGVRAKHSIRRAIGDPPSDGSGRWVSDRTYVSGGIAIARKEFRPW
ncbi:MAG TPA: hypothetical protein VME46_20745 [Acidimicrobiales bacterium]|nr:hypothetical protein [Acidimicrobiales bacterium]